MFLNGGVGWGGGDLFLLFTLLFGITPQTGFPPRLPVWLKVTIQKLTSNLCLPGSTKFISSQIPLRMEVMCVMNWENQTSTWNVIQSVNL